MASPTYTIQTLTNYYTALLAFQYRTSPKAIATMQILTKQAVADYMAQQLEECFQLSTAVGAQLDIIGKYIGVARNVGPAVGQTYHGMELYGGGGNIHGFYSYAGEVNTGVVWLRYAYNSGPNTNLTDQAYRQALYLKILLNTCSESMATIEAGLYALFGTPNFTGSGTGVMIVSISGGAVTGVTVPTPFGTGYTLPPYVYFTGGGGTGAIGLASVGSPTAHKIGGVTILQGGTGYTTTPTAHLSSSLIKVTDNLNMSLTYDVLPYYPWSTQPDPLSPNDLVLPTSVLQAYLPRPMGVSMTVVQH